MIQIIQKDFISLIQFLWRGATWTPEPPSASDYFNANMLTLACYLLTLCLLILLIFTVIG